MTIDRSIYSLDEAAFLDALSAEMKQTGNLSDVFRQMVTYNVPLFVLGKFASDKKEEWLAGETELSFCIAEDGWRGRTSNVQSTFKPAGDGYEIDFSKSYCMLSAEPATTMLIFCLAHDDPNQFGIAPIVADETKQKWESRGETSGLFQKSDGTKYDHYRVTGRVQLAEDELIRLERQKYKPLGLEIPKREVTSLSVLAVAQCEHAGLTPPQAIVDAVASIKQGRQNGKIDRAVLNSAAACLDYFSAQSLSGVHALWEKIDIFSRILPKPKPA